MPLTVSPCVPLSAGDVKFVTAGHDHINDFCADAMGLKMCYGGGFGYYAYGKVRGGAGVEAAVRGGGGLWWRWWCDAARAGWIRAARWLSRHCHRSSRPLTWRVL